MERYRLLNDGTIKRLSDLAVIPPIADNPDYVKFLSDRDLGVEVLPYDYAAENLRQQEAQVLFAANKVKEDLIQEKIRAQAIEALKIEGKL